MDSFQLEDIFDKLNIHDEQQQSVVKNIVVQKYGTLPKQYNSQMVMYICFQLPPPCSSVEKFVKRCGRAGISDTDMAYASQFYNQQQLQKPVATWVDALERQHKRQNARLERQNTRLERQNANERADIFYAMRLQAAMVMTSETFNSTMDKLNAIAVPNCIQSDKCTAMELCTPPRKAADE